MQNAGPTVGENAKCTPREIDYERSRARPTVGEGISRAKEVVRFTHDEMK